SMAVSMPVAALRSSIRKSEEDKHCRLLKSEAGDLPTVNQRASKNNEAIDSYIPIQATPSD
ncbi:MAG: hypothetical protein OEZ23_07945, partial [Gammaproteobacteria bacterium]|nr:hypothetical protein [Gammaproteobacteria bacterium]